MISLTRVTPAGLEDGRSLLEAIVADVLLEIIDLPIRSLTATHCVVLEKIRTLEKISLCV